MIFKERFNNLAPGQKKLVIWSLIAAAFLLLTVIGYNASRSPEKNAAPAVAEKNREISLEPDLMQKAMLREQRRELENMRQELAQIRSRDQAPPPPVDSGEEKILTIPSAEDLEKYPPMGGSPRNNFPLPPGQLYPPPPPPAAQPVETLMIGGIGVLSNDKPIPASTEPEDKKKGRRTVYLPPSFMEARLLTGFDASTSGAGTNNPEPILLRIQTPAVLPNDIKANLRGCFIVAEAVGRLHKERADVRLVSLSCLSISGDAIIDTPIKGFVTDSDSKVGLSGRVVSRMGAATARTVMAGIFGGAGDALKAASQTSSISALGSTSLVDSADLAKSAAGGGLSAGAKSLHDFYLDLAKQSTPVIEVGATKNITVVVSEGKELEILEINNGQL